MVKPIEVPSCAHVLNTAPPKACVSFCSRINNVSEEDSRDQRRQDTDRSSKCRRALNLLEAQTNAGMVATPMIKSEMVVAVLMLLTSAESVLRYCQS
ncbi:hypothetical protein KCV00_g215, partial [Aureobasidium melanogenum]